MIDSPSSTSPGHTPGPAAPGPEGVSMRRVLGIAALCCGVVLLLWKTSGIELRGYGQSLAPGGVAAITDEAPVVTPDFVSERTMNEGVELLYQQDDPEGALRAFDAVLERQPEHYGALYQRAKALDERRQLSLALEAWRRFEPRALAVGDTTYLQQARQRIVILDQWVSTLKAKMSQALVLLHNQGNPDASLPLLREVLDTWPTHYGARYQYAYALEEVDEVEQAREAWALFLVEAHTLQATADITAANEALQRLSEY